VQCTVDGTERLKSLKTTVIDKIDKRLLNCISVEVFLWSLSCYDVTFQHF
jgi:hypothetical protein